MDLPRLPNAVAPVLRLNQRGGQGRGARHAVSREGGRLQRGNPPASACRPARLARMDSRAAAGQIASTEELNWNRCTARTACKAYTACTACPAHLRVHGGVPVAVVEDDVVGARQVHAHAAAAGGIGEEKLAFPCFWGGFLCGGAVREEL